MTAPTVSHGVIIRLAREQPATEGRDCILHEEHKIAG